MKSNWKDIGDLRKPDSRWRLGKAAKWWERALGLPPNVVVFKNPDGSVARSDKTLKALRRDWTEKLVKRPGRSKKAR